MIQEETLEYLANLNIQDTNYRLNDFEKAVLCLHKKNYPTILKHRSFLDFENLYDIVNIRIVVELSKFNVNTPIWLVYKDLEYLIETYQENEFSKQTKTELETVFTSAQELLYSHIQSKKFYVPEEYIFFE